MIPHESLGKEVYCVNVFNVRTVLELLAEHPCVYYNCRSFERASMQVESLQHSVAERSLTDRIVIRRVGRRVVAERGEQFDATLSSEIPSGGDFSLALESLNFNARPDTLWETITAATTGE